MAFLNFCKLIITNGFVACKSNVSNFNKDIDKKFLATISRNFYTELPNLVFLVYASKDFYKDS